jgi:hypothetical protein
MRRRVLSAAVLGVAGPDPQRRRDASLDLRRLRLPHRQSVAACTLSATGAFSRRFAPKIDGQYRRRVLMDGTAACRALPAGWSRCFVRRARRPKAERGPRVTV